MSIDVLLTGFAPFDGAAVNESWLAVREAAPALRAAEITTRELELPVEFGRAGAELLQAARECAPRLIVAVGLAAGRQAVTPERVAINIRDARIPDAAGASPVDEPVVPGGPVGYFSTLPIKAMTEALAAQGLPAAVSQSAGTYVCNDVFYLLAHALATDPQLAQARGGFVHVPAADVAPPAAVARGLVAAIRTALESPEDLVVTGGAEH